MTTFRPARKPSTRNSVLAGRFQGAVVTGVTSGLGKAFAQMLLNEGVEVWGTSRQVDRIESTDRLHGLQLDLCCAASVRAFCDAIRALPESVNLLINNAGGGVFARLDELTDAAIEEQVAGLLIAPMLITRAFAQRTTGSAALTVVNVASLTREFPMPFFSPYNAAKAGLSNFSRSLQIEWAGTGRRIIDFQPGDFCTSFNQRAATVSSTDSRVARAWESLERNLNASPLPEKAASDLRKVLLRNDSGCTITGSFLQARLFPFLARLGTWNLVARAIRFYYRI